MPDAHGGSRQGAGRPTNADAHREPIADFTARAAGYLPTAFDNLARLASGELVRVETKYERAACLTRKDVARDDDGEILRDKNGKPTVIEVPAFPGIDADEWVAVERKVTPLAPDFRANEYIINRAMGTPTPAATPDPEGLDLRAALIVAARLVAAYADPDAEPTKALPAPAHEVDD
jgi:hypothetical protein